MFIIASGLIKIFSCPCWHFQGRSITFDHSKKIVFPKDNSQDAFCPQLPFELSETEQREWRLWWFVFVLCTCTSVEVTVLYRVPSLGEGVCDDKHSPWQIRTFIALPWKAYQPAARRHWQTLPGVVRLDSSPIIQATKLSHELTLTLAQVKKCTYICNSIYMKSDFCFLGTTLLLLRRNKDAVKLLVGGLTNMILFNSLSGGKMHNQVVTTSATSSSLIGLQVSLRRGLSLNLWCNMARYYRNSG